MKRIAILALSLIGLLLGFVQAHHHGPGPQAGMGMAMSQITSELDFLTQMIPHHQEAVDSARQLLTVTERPELRQLAEAIIEEQSREIALMQGWLAAWYPEAERDVDYAPMMRSLNGLSPEEAERTFIEDMIKHHQMAVMMARQLLMRNLAEREEVAALAQDVVATQTAEIAQLQSWLRDWYGPAMARGRPGMMEGMMGQGMMMAAPDTGMMGMRQGMMDQGMVAMMQRCLAMMGQDPMLMMGPMMGMAQYGPEAIKALARAFLAGYRPDAELIEVQPPQLLYTATFRDGEVTRTLVIDATTGEVRLEP
jgi:uncharacterized protein (DUF305 family)